MITFKRMLLISALLFAHVGIVHAMNMDEKETDQKTAYIQIGINYTGSQNQLKGCGNDIKNFFEQRCYPRLESGALNYQSSEFYVLTDYAPYTKSINETLKSVLQEQKLSNDQKNYILGSCFIDLNTNTKIPNQTHLVFGDPTRANIESVIEHVMGKNDIKYVVLQYSGHGSQAKATLDLQEDDGKDEVLIPVDHLDKGIINDDWLKKTVVDTMRYKPKLLSFFALMDCCHSGTLFDLSHRATLNKQNGLEVGANCKHIRESNYLPNILALSGCQDNQTSADAYLDNSYQGALTHGFLNTCKQLDRDFSWPLENLLTSLDSSMKGFDQRPLLTSGFCLESKCQDTNCQKYCRPESGQLIQARINQALCSVLGK